MESELSSDNLQTGWDSTMNRMLLLASGAMFMAVAGSPVSAETLNVQGVVAPYCNVSLTNVSSGTASIAMVNTQQIANLKLSCNGASGTTMVTTVKNGDLVSGDGKARINYAMELKSPDDSAFSIAEHDTNPIGGENNLFFTRHRAGYTQPIANGIPLELWMNVNVAVDPNQAAGSANYPANAAPAGTYTEVFTFTSSAV